MLEINARLANNVKDFLKYTNRPTYIAYKKFDKKYAAIHEIKPALRVRKPINNGSTVLELSKWLMYDLHYIFIKKHFDAELFFTDTGSLTYKIKSGDIYELFFRHKHLCDFSNYPDKTRARKKIK